jgi:hypothetical protein
MSFSGRYPEHDTCENFNAIDVRELQRKNLLRPGLCFIKEWFRHGAPSGEIFIMTQPDAIMLVYRVRPPGTEHDAEMPQAPTPLGCLVSRSCIQCTREAFGRPSGSMIVLAMDVVDDDPVAVRRHRHPVFPAQRALCVLVAALPVFAHRGAGEFMVFGMTSRARPRGGWIVPPAVAGRRLLPAGIGRLQQGEMKFPLGGGHLLRLCHQLRHPAIRRIRACIRPPVMGLTTNWCIARDLPGSGGPMNSPNGRYGIYEPDMQIARIKCGRPHLMRNVALELMWRPAPLSVCRNGKPLPGAT